MRQNLKNVQPHSSHFAPEIGQIMQVESLAIAEVLLITPKQFCDDRGFFSEVYNRQAFAEAGITCDFVQDNHSRSVRPGTVRGLHFQAPPCAQAKLVRVVSGCVLDVAVDARRGSPTFGAHVKAELSAETGTQIFVPPGFLHGFITLEPNTQVTYKVDRPYSHEADGAVRFDDPDLAIEWGEYASRAVLSERDAKAQSWNDFSSPFVYSE